MTDLYPFLLEPKYEPRIWGGTYLREWLRLESAPEPLAEVWLVYDDNRVLNGAYAGRTLADLTAAHGADLIGSVAYQRYGADFPLLAKFLDSGDRLSIQVHPDDEYAHSHEAATGFHGKNEAWYIVHTAPAATVVHGFARPVDAATVAAAARDGSILDLVREVPVQPDAVVYVPAGTIHAINPGVMLFEIQQKSDLTYRVYDYERPRELHLQQALDVLHYDTSTIAIAPPQPLDDQRTCLLHTPFFVLERWQIADRLVCSTDAASCDLLTVVDGTVELTWHTETLRLQRGQSVVVPACLGAYTLQAYKSATLLRCAMPQEAQS